MITPTKFCIIGILLLLLGSSTQAALVYNRYDTNSDNVAAGLVNNQATAVVNTNVPGFIANILSYGAVSGRQLFGTITSNSPTVTITSGSVSAADVGSLVKIQTGRATNIDLVSTISAFVNSINFTLPRNCSNTALNVSIVISPVDNTVAISNACRSVILAGGGTVKIPPGIWWHTEVDLPQIGNNYYDEPVPIVIEGPTPVGFCGNYLIRPNVACLFYGGETGTGGSGISAGGSAFNNVYVIVRNLLMRAPLNPNLNELNLANALLAGIYNVAVDTGLGEYAAGLPAPAYGTNSCGISLPISSNAGGGNGTVDNVIVSGGFANGFFGYGEHNTFKNVVVINCYNAFSPGPAGVGVTFSGETCIEGCFNMFNGDYISGGSARFVVVNLATENNAAGWWLSKCLVEDTNQILAPTILSSRSAVMGVPSYLTNNNGGLVFSISYPADKVYGQNASYIWGADTNEFDTTQPSGIIFTKSGFANYSQIKNRGTNTGILFTPNDGNSTTFDLYFSAGANIGTAYEGILRSYSAGGIALIGAYQGGGTQSPQAFTFINDKYSSGNPVWGSDTTGRFWVTNGISSTATNALMTITSTGCTNKTGVSQTAWITAGTSMTLKDAFGNTEFSAVTVATMTPIRVQNNGTLVGTAITGTSHAW